MEQFDVAIVGAGPTGLACGIEVQKRGFSPVLFDKGCVVNSIYHYPINLVFFTTPELLEIGDIPMTSLNEKPGRTEALKYYRRVADHYRLNIHQYERVLDFSGSDGTFVVRTETNHTVYGLLRHSEQAERAWGGSRQSYSLLSRSASLLQPGRAYRGGKEFRLHRRLGVILDGRARYTGASQRWHLEKR
jgi:glycine/D-amino acid oxidase-like deaminating enzyme